MVWKISEETVWLEENELEENCRRGQRGRGCMCWVNHDCTDRGSEPRLHIRITWRASLKAANPDVCKWAGIGP